MSRQMDLKFYRSQGVGLIEVMVTSFILAVGLLAVVAMQGLAKSSSYEAQQRTYAMLMAESMVERVHLNRSAWADEFGTTTQVDADDTLTADCVNSSTGLMSGCDADDLVDADLYFWNEYMSQNSLQDYSGCVILGNNGDFEVIVSWASRVELGGTATVTDDTCLVNGASRRSISLTSRIST